MQRFSSFARRFGQIKRRKRRQLSLSQMLKWTLLVIAVAGIGLTLYCWYLSVQIEKRFSGRRWSIPSKVFSDSTILYPGQTLNRPLFTEKLRQLGYHEVSHEPERAGEMRNFETVSEVFLRDYEAPPRERKGFRVQIEFWKNEIDSIFLPDKGEHVPILELEPQEIAMLFGPERERRQLVSINQVPRHLIHAVLSAEDKRFYEHHGVDPVGIGRAFFTNLRRGAIVQGGSTITQQLAKCYFLTPEKTITRKLKELLMSLIIELKYSKAEILEIYLNEIYLGQKASVSINGVGEASYFYFGKPVDELSLPEAACIAGLIKAPNRYSPYVDQEKCSERRNRVLRIMFDNGWITQEQLDSALAAPIVTAGAMDYKREAPYFVDYLKDQLASLYSPEDLASLGLSIFTTLDTQVQMAAERALERGLARLEQSIPQDERSNAEEKIQGAVIVIQPKTGYILAMVGGRDYTVSQFNRVTQARRQPGSAFKPFVYLSALDEFTPASLISNEPVSYEDNGEPWEPQNFEPIPEQSLSMREALSRSVNRATVNLAMEIGLKYVIDTAKSFEFSTDFRPVPSLSLGAFEVVPLEMARAYCAFAADGVLPHPLSLKEVIGSDGKTLERKHMTIENAISPAKAFLMTSLLHSVIRDGTGKPLNTLGISFPVAGKTGTTNDFRDAWFVGYTPRILALIWVGFDDESPIYATGSKAALPIWAELMNSIPQYTSGEWFAAPPGIVERVVCLDSGELGTRRCPHKRREIFLEETAPNVYCQIHGKRDLLRRVLQNE
jgi:penicillin-binding protein 1B